MNEHIPPYALWLFGLAAFGWIVGPVLGYYLGIHSQRETFKREARIAVLAMIDRIGTDILANKYSPEVSLLVHERLKETVFYFSNRLGKGSGIQWAWQEYEGKTGNDRDPIWSMDNLIALRKVIKRA